MKMFRHIELLKNCNHSKNTKTLNTKMSTVRDIQNAGRQDSQGFRYQKYAKHLLCYLTNKQTTDRSLVVPTYIQEQDYSGIHEGEGKSG